MEESASHCGFHWRETRAKSVTAKRYFSAPVHEEKDGETQKELFGLDN